MRVRKRKDRHSYYCEFYHAGKWVRYSCKTQNKTLAGKVARKIYEEVVAGRFGISSGRRYPLAELLDKYLALCKMQGLMERTIVRARQAIHNVLAGLSVEVADEVTTPKLQEYVGRRLSGAVRTRKNRKPRKASPFTVNAELTHLKAFLRACVRQHWLSRVPCEFRMLRTPTKGRIAFLAESEIGPFLDNLETWARWTAYLLISTGLRCEEMMFLEWGDVHLDAGILWVCNKPHLDYHPKGGRERSVPLSPDLAAELTARAQASGWVCPGPSGGQINRAWFAKAVARAGKASGLTQRVTPHVLRHTFGTLLAMSGAPLPAVQNIMGHANLSTTAIYLHVSDEARRNAIAKLPRIAAERPEQKVVPFGASVASGGKGRS